MKSKRDMRHTRLALALVGVLVVSIVAPTGVGAWWEPQYEVGIRITGIGWQGNPFSNDVADKPMMSAAAWPLTFYLTPRRSFQGYGTPSTSKPYPGFGGFVRWGSNGYYAWVFGQEATAFGADLCPSWDSMANPLAWEGCELEDPDYTDPSTWWPIDETVLPFGAGMTTPASCSNSCSEGDTSCVPCELGPEITLHECTFADTVGNDDGNCSPDPDEYEACPCSAAPRNWNIGPRLGSADDGYGYGYSPRLPGLVVVADAGVGVVTENDPTLERPVRTSPLRCRNLAGFTNSVGYVLSDARYKSHISAQMLVPGLFTPVVLSDADTAYWQGETETSCDYEGDGLNDDTLIVIDGREPECWEGGVATYSQV